MACATGCNDGGVEGVALGDEEIARGESEQESHFEQADGREIKREPCSCI